MDNHNQQLHRGRSQPINIPGWEPTYIPSTRERSRSPRYTPSPGVLRNSDEKDPREPQEGEGLREVTFRSRQGVMRPEFGLLQQRRPRSYNSRRTYASGSTHGFGDPQGDDGFWSRRESSLGPRFQEHGEILESDGEISDLTIDTSDLEDGGDSTDWSDGMWEDEMGLSRYCRKEE